MTRRWGTLVLVAVVTLVGINLCPQGTLSCAIVMQAVRDCCRHDTAIRGSECCCPPRATQAAATTIATFNQPHDGHLLAVSLAQPVSHTHGPILSATCLKRPQDGRSPPSTLVTRHTSLLL